MFSPLVEARIIFITAIINIVAILMVLLSCRCINSWKITAWLAKYHWFKRYFKWHCYVWYVLLPSIIVHAVFAIQMLGVPF
jgi:hypothetical protein